MGIQGRNVRKGIEIYENGDDSYLYLPGELLVDAAHDAHAERVLDGAIRGKRDQHDRLDVSHYDVDGDLHAIVERLRKDGVRCGPNHILAGEPRYIGGPATIIEPTDYGLAEPKGEEGAGVTIAVLDTGFRTDVQQWLVDRVDAVPPDEPLDTHTPDGSLDHEAGHGTFIAGVIADLAPRARIIVRQVLESDGFGDEATIAQTITEVAALQPDIINLSLGAYTHGNLPPIGLANALRQVPRTSVVVAAAGNAEHRRAVLAGGAEAGLVGGGGRRRRSAGRFLQLRPLGRLRRPRRRRHELLPDLDGRRPRAVPTAGRCGAARASPRRTWRAWSRGRSPMAAAPPPRRSTACSRGPAGSTRWSAPSCSDGGTRSFAQTTYHEPGVALLVA